MRQDDPRIRILTLAPAGDEICCTLVGFIRHLAYGRRQKPAWHAVASWCLLAVQEHQRMAPVEFGPQRLEDVVTK
jgi:hypothetical protein